jgi:ABC-2 type transport system permease protein
MKRYVWLLRREFWENRAIWIIPLAIGGLMVFAATFGRVHITLFQVDSADSAVAFFFVTGMIFYAAMNIYAFWYLLDCLYADRKDRSVLFWKSMPITDAATVLSKVFVALVALPIVYLLAAGLASAVVAAIATLRSKVPAGVSLWRPEIWLLQQVLWVYMTAASMIWYLPVAGWLLLVSAWARRAVILHAVLPPLGLILAERLLLGTHAVESLLRSRLGNFKDAAFKFPGHFSLTSADGASHIGSFLDPAGFFGNPAVWIGAVIGAALIAGAIELRKRRADA